MFGNLDRPVWRKRCWGGRFWLALFLVGITWLFFSIARADSLDDFVLSSDASRYMRHVVTPCESGGGFVVPSALILPIGVKIWFNECGGSNQGLVCWNQGENFMAMGIGHFVWHPRGSKRGSWQHGFPRLLKYMQQHGVQLPEWLSVDKALCAPWSNRDEFIASPRDVRLLELRQLLRDNLGLQARFLVEDLLASFPRMLEITPRDDRALILHNFCKLVAEPQGLYVMVDYLNFKGPGIHPSRSNYYQGSGLLQVLRGMQFAPSHYTPIQAFVYSAKIALARRVERSGGQYQRWLNGWFNRLNSYLE